jgi:hypothetical protein
MGKIAFLFTGEARCNSLSHNVNKDYEIINSYSKFIFTDEFKSKYDYDIFISTDDIHLKNTFDYFGENKIKNIHLLNTNYYFKPINVNIPRIEYFINKYLNHNKNGCGIYLNSIHQHYKILDAYNLLENYGDIYDYDYIFRLRLDIQFTNNILNGIRIFENPKTEIVCNWDTYGIGKPKMMKWYCTGLLNRYGMYNFEYNLDRPHEICKDYFDLKNNLYKRWTYAPEIQLFEHLFEYCKIHNLNVHEAIRVFGCCYIKR